MEQQWIKYTKMGIKFGTDGYRLPLLEREQLRDKWLHVRRTMFQDHRLPRLSNQAKDILTSNIVNEIWADHKA